MVHPLPAQHNRPATGVKGTADASSPLDPGRWGRFQEPSAANGQKVLLPSYTEILTLPLDTEKTPTIVATFLALHVTLVRKKRGRLREKHRKGTDCRIPHLVLHILPAPIVRQFFKSCLYYIKHVLK